jgi:cyanophycinase
MASARATLGTYVGDSLAVGIFLTEDNAAAANDTTVARRIRGCSGFFFTGGDQSRVVDTFLPHGDTTAAYRALRRRWEEGAVISGSSAGAAMMSGVMIASGSSVGAVENGVTDSEEAGGVWIRRGMGFFDRAIIDQHFLSRGRIGRLLVAVLDTDSLPVGLGIDENTALVVDGDVATVRGASGVVLVDGRNAAVADPGRGTGLRVSLVGVGDRIDLGTFKVTRAPGKSPLPVVEGASLDVTDPFARWSFLHLVAELVDSSAEQASFDVAGGARLTVRRGTGFSGASDDGEGVQGVPAGLSAGPFVVDLVQEER